VGWFAELQRTPTAVSPPHSSIDFVGPRVNRFSEVIFFSLPYTPVVCSEHLAIGHFGSILVLHGSPTPCVSPLLDFVCQLVYLRACIIMGGEPAKCRRGREKRQQRATSETAGIQRADVLFGPTNAPFLPC